MYKSTAEAVAALLSSSIKSQVKIEIKENMFLPGNCYVKVTKDDTECEIRNADHIGYLDVVISEMNEEVLNEKSA